MDTNYNKIKSDLLALAKKDRLSADEYQRLLQAESIEDVISVVKDKFELFAGFEGFDDVLMTNRELFEKRRIWINKDVFIQDGVGFLLATEGVFSADSRGS